ncbi:MAG: lipoyl(octanoyl) transferase LipB [Thermodesulfobacteriota bacterium]
MTAATQPTDQQKRPLDIRQLGTVPYDEAMLLQKQLVEMRAADEIGDTLLLLEHPPTYTVGLRGDDTNFLVPRPVLESKGAVIRTVERGGDVTFHGPGQLVGYPIIDVPAVCGDINSYVFWLEQVLIETLAAFGVSAGRLAGFRGVWVDDRKIAAIGVRVNSHGISSHGFAVNVNTDLSFFDAIVACGLHGKSVTSLAKALNEPVEMNPVIECLTKTFARVFK